MTLKETDKVGVVYVCVDWDAVCGNSTKKSGGVYPILTNKSEPNHNSGVAAVFGSGYQNGCLTDFPVVSRPNS